MHRRKLSLKLVLIAFLALAGCRPAPPISTPPPNTVAPAVETAVQQPTVTPGVHSPATTQPTFAPTEPEPSPTYGRRPTSERTRRPTLPAPALPTRTFTVASASPRPVPTSAVADIEDACTFVPLSQLPDFFPDPPSQTRGNGAILSTDPSGDYCMYASGDVSFRIVIYKTDEFVRFVGSAVDASRMARSEVLFNDHSAEVAFYIAPSGSGVTNTVFARIFRDDVSAEILLTGLDPAADQDTVRPLLKLVLDRFPERVPVLLRMKACSLVNSQTLAAMFSEPPQPVHLYSDPQTADGLMSTCKYENEETTFEIAFGYETEGARTQIASLPEFTHAKAAGTDIYFSNLPDDQGGDFRAVIFKGDRMVVMVARGSGYQYDYDRELSLLKTVADRLP